MTLTKKLAAAMSGLFQRKRQVAAALQESESRYRQVRDHIREVFFLCDPQITRMLYVSPGYQDLWGRSC